MGGQSRCLKIIIDIKMGASTKKCEHSFFLYIIKNKRKS